MLSARSAGSAMGPSLLCRVGASICALTVDYVDEIMRPLPVERVTKAPSFVLGLSVIRGEPTPVIDLASFLSAEGPSAESADPAARFIAVRTGDRRVALRVEAVLGVRTLTMATLAELPPLLQQANAALIAQVGTLDAELLLVLRGAQLVPSELWAELGESVQ
jgi:purine-binding chemotaxis protein CheW